MSLNKLAGIFLLKYATENPAMLEASIKQDIFALWNIPHKLFNILLACSEAEPKGAKTADEKIAVEGFKFCQSVVTKVNFLKNNLQTVSPDEIRESVLQMVNEISSNATAIFSEDGKFVLAPEPGETPKSQFYHVSELIRNMIPVSTKQDRNMRDGLFNKAKTGLSRMLSIGLTILKKLDQLEMIDPTKFTYETHEGTDIDLEAPERIAPQRAALTTHKIVDFIRRHGDKYGLPTRDDWGAIVDGDRELKELLTTVINAINRGHSPRDSAEVMAQIKEIRRRLEQRFNPIDEVPYGPEKKPEIVVDKDAIPLTDLPERFKKYEK